MPSKSQYRSAPAALFIQIDKSRPLREQICTQIRRAIREVRLVPDDRLPSLRCLAAELSVSVDTVSDAYRHLESEKLVESRRGSGFYVCGSTVESALMETKQPRTEQQDPASECLPKPSAEILEKTKRVRQSIVPIYRKFPRAPLATYASGMELIADKNFLRLSAQLARSPWLHNTYSDPQGYLPLRKAICVRLRESQGVMVKPEQVVITSGLIQTMSLLAQVLFNPGDTVWGEDPGYTTISEIFRFRGLLTAPVGVDENGADIERAMETSPHAKGIFISVASQYPMSVPLADERAEALLDWSRRTGGWIIEDGTDGMISLTGKPYVSLFHRAGGVNRVIFTESFSLLIAPGLRLGYVVLPAPFAEVCTAVRYLSDRSSAERSQALLADFLNSDFYNSFARRLARHYKQCYGVLRSQVQNRLAPYGRLWPAKFGCHVAFELTTPIEDTALSERLAEKGIPLKTLSSFCEGEKNVNGLLLGFGTSSKKEIIEAIDCIATVCDDMLRNIASEPK